ncbi:MAG: ABC transporter substrate-binding protein, partial [Planctomycetota bacterium]
MTVTRRRLIDVIEGRVDAAVGYTTDLNWFEKEMGAKASQLKPSNFGVDFYGDSLFTRRAFTEQAPDVVKAFRKASLKGWRYALTHGNEVAD